VVGKTSVIGKKTNLNLPKKSKIMMNKVFQLGFALALVFSLGACNLFRKSEKIPESKTYTSKKIEKIVGTARTYVGTPYKYGGTTEVGMDCSGLVFTAFNAASLKLPRTSEAMSEVGVEVPKRAIRVGDLVFFATGKSSAKISHVGLVTTAESDRILFIHSSTSKGVREDNLSSEYYTKAFVKAMRPF
jgi:probable lipoprotein NlpC